MADAKAKEVIARHDRRKADRSVFETTWQQITNYIHTNRNDMIVERTPGTKRMQYVYDSHPIWCREQFAAGCHSFLTSSTLQWFALRVEDDRIDAMPAVRAWLDIAGAAMYAVFNSPRYNFASQSGEFYDDLGSIGSACMAVLENKEGMPLFSARHMKECLWAENDEDRVDSMSRKFKWPARKAYAKWGAAAGEKVVKAMDAEPEKPFWFHHAVEPRSKRDPQRADQRNMAWESVYVSEADLTTITESGFTEFPFLCGRNSKTSDEYYGRGNGWTALPDTKMLNEAVKLVYKAAQKVIDPVLDMPDDTYLVPIKTIPGSILIRRRGASADDRIAAVRTEGNIQIGNDMIERLHNSISKMFFVDLLRMPSDPQDPSSEGKGSTATYWMQRREKDMMALAPFLARGQSEFTGPAIDRVFAQMFRKSQRLKFGEGSPFPPPPSILSGQRLRPEYVSPLALAQKSSELDNLGRLINTQLTLRQIDPKCPMVLNVIKIMRRSARDLNTAPDALRTDDDLDQEAQQKAQQQEQMQQQMQMESLAKSGKDGGAALKNLSDAGGGTGAGNDNSGRQAA